jgi:hypothetical protein
VPRCRVTPWTGPSDGIAPGARGFRSRCSWRCCFGRRFRSASCRWRMPGVASHSSCVRERSLRNPGRTARALRTITTTTPASLASTIPAALLKTTRSVPLPPAQRVRRCRCPSTWAMPLRKISLPATGIRHSFLSPLSTAHKARADLPPPDTSDSIFVSLSGVLFSGKGES